MEVSLQRARQAAAAGQLLSAACTGGLVETIERLAESIDAPSSLQPA